MHVEMAVHTVRSSSSGLNSTHESVRTGQQEDGVRHINGPGQTASDGRGRRIEEQPAGLGLCLSSLV